MRTVDDFAALRRAHRDGKSIRLIAQQFGVGRDTVRKALQHPEPLPYTLAQPRAAPVFGPIAVDFPDGRRQVPVLIVTWSYSNAPFALALPTERNGAVLHGLASAFAFFGCVPQELWWDNPATVAIHIWRGRERT